MAEENEIQSQSSSEQPIIIKKIKKAAHGHHGGAWKVAYSDFVTAMMAFFIVMWILAQGEETKAGVAEYFNDPSQFDIFTGQKTSPIDMHEFPAKGGGKGEGKGSEPKSFTWSFSEGEDQDTTLKIEQSLMQAMQDSVAAAEKVQQVSNDIRQTVSELRGKSLEMQDLVSSLSIEIAPEGLQIELIESQDNHFFEIGSAKLKPAAVQILSQLAKKIGMLPNPIEIAGHTDSRKYSSPSIYSNWELSTDRANAARKVLEQNGTWNGQIITVAGYADKKLKNESNPFDVSNRRVSILVKHISSEQFINNMGNER
ncbi:MAG: OmpA family protein [Ignavibacteria bacterium]|jgi:chemotaxis protein MotB|nr:OmpA family protein [Ignavibacteria bacterium]